MLLPLTQLFYMVHHPPIILPFSTSIGTLSNPISVGSNFSANKYPYHWHSQWQFSAPPLATKPRQKPMAPHSRKTPPLVSHMIETSQPHSTAFDHQSLHGPYYSSIVVIFESSTSKHVPALTIREHMPPSVLKLLPLPPLYVSKPLRPFPISLC
jgi:hypothetical protein